ncbi:hypothetical protein Plo01_43920 [Planobispora longispora]|uniref:Uncharacterized protein n=1 Tax=Planobispora longispora TaxID=28887 RepID=A0A8J3RMY5_9ACTN|nr:hypothetical protein Plo01_43920 [Planobispora longispora]
MAERKPQSSPLQGPNFLKSVEKNGGSRKGHGFIAALDPLRTTPYLRPKLGTFTNAEEEVT